MEQQDRIPPTPHLEDEVIEAAASGEIEPDARRHLRECPRCRKRVDQLGTVLELLGDAFELTTSPGWFRSRALAALKRVRERGRDFRGYLRCTFDSLISTAPNGARGPAGPGRQLLFEGSGYELDIHLVPPSEESPGAVTGQLLPASDAPEQLAYERLLVRVRDRHGNEASSVPDRFGMFSLNGDWRAPLEIAIDGERAPLEVFVPCPFDIEPDSADTP
jgi:hypothetical protein